MPPTREELNALEQWARGRDRRLARRAALVLAAVQGQSDMAVAVRFRVSKQTVSKWRGRFQDRRLEGLLDEPRPGAPRRITDGDVERVLRLTRAAPPVGLGRWTTRSMARASGLSQTAISRIWRSHGLDPRQLPAARSAAEPDARVDAGPPRADERPRASPPGTDSTRATGPAPDGVDALRGRRNG